MPPPREHLLRRVEDAVRKLVVRQAGGIVFRCDKRGRVRVLLVSSRRSPDRWVLPKGSIKRRESAADAALREVREESGVRGKIRGRAGTARYGSRRGLIRVDYFVIAFRSASDDAHEARRMEWVSIDTAGEMLGNPSVRTVLLRARTAIEAAAHKERPLAPTRRRH